jgi:hypothetical protein
MNTTFYLVVDDFGSNGRVFREADIQQTDLETVIIDLLAGEYKNPVRVVAFNIAEKWSQDVSADVAHELRQRCDLQERDVPVRLGRVNGSTRGRYHDVQLPCRCGWSELVSLSARAPMIWFHLIV